MSTMDKEEKILKILDEQKKQLDRIERLLTMKKITSSIKTAKPEINKSKKLTVPTLLLLFKEEKFFDQPKTLNDIVQKFQQENRNIKPNGLTLPLQKLVRNRELARMLKDGRWAYVKR